MNDIPLLDFADDLLEFDLPEKIPGFTLDFDLPETAIATETVTIKRYPRPQPHAVKYQYAAELAAATPDLAEGEAMFAVVSGNFIFGDYLEALMVEKNYYAKEMLVATLSLGKENVDSLRNLQAGDYLAKLGLIVSDFWYAHERRAAGGVPYIEKTLSCQDFSFAAAGIHTKITLIRTACGRHLVLHGSANLRSSRNVEQFVIENNRGLFDFNHRWMSHLLQTFSATKKSKRGDQLWQDLQVPTKKASSPIGEKEKPQQKAVTQNGNN